MSSNLIKELREKTGAGFLECKKALDQCDGNLEKAEEVLRKKGMADAAKRQGRLASQGVVHSYIHSNSKIGVLLELNCETDFVAKTDEFNTLAHDIAMHVAALNPRYLSKGCVPAEDVEKEKEVFRVQAANTGKPGPVVEKIVEGKLGKFYEEACLLQQPFIKQPEKSVEMLVKEVVAKLGENIEVRRFTRFQVGETVKAS